MFLTRNVHIVLYYFKISVYVICNCRSSLNNIVCVTCTCRSLRCEFPCDAIMYKKLNMSLTLSLFCVRPDCQDPILEPPDLCVSPGTNYTCMATSGYPPPPTYDFSYWHHEDGSVADYTIRSSLTPPSYAVHRIGNFSVSCCVNYAHPVYPECYATCYANTTVFSEYYNILLTFEKKFKGTIHVIRYFGAY